MIALIDKIIILIAFPLLLCLGVIICILKILFDGRPIFYLSARYSNFENSFVSIKFRSMTNKKQLIEREVKKYSDGGFQVIPLSSEVYTRFGKFLEYTQLVELPQIVNCLRGDLYLVGARPLPKENLVKLHQDFGQELVNERGCRKGGIAGAAQMMGKAELNVKQRLEIEAMEAKFLKDGNSLLRISIYLLILFGTFLFIVRRKPCKPINEIVLKTFEQHTHLK